MINKKQIIVISNPFGFGPTGSAIAIIEQLMASLSGEIELIYAASDKCLEPLSETLRNKIKIVRINERDSDEISMILNMYNRPLVIVCLNRIAINTAKDLKLDAFFVDSLTWLWREIPKDYLRANIYYAYDIFDARVKVKDIRNAKLVSPALGKLPRPQKNKKNLILINIGGFTNPLREGFSKKYLLMLANSIGSFTDKKRFVKIVITGGSEPLSFLKGCIKKSENIVIKTLSRQDFLLNLNESNLFVTTPGLMATLEAFALKTFTAFLPPINLSQWKQLKLLAKVGLTPQKMEWENYCSIDWNFDLLDEKEAIPKFTKLANVVYYNNLLRSKFERDIIETLLLDEKFISSQSKFIQKIGTNGAEIIARDVRLFLRNR